MFSTDELLGCIHQNWFLAGHGQLERSLLQARLGLEGEPLSVDLKTKLKRFSQAVIASASTWETPREGAGRRLCQLAADIEAALALSGGEAIPSHAALFKAVVLYDLAGLPGASASFASRNGFDPRLREFFNRSTETIWGSKRRSCQ